MLHRGISTEALAFVGKPFTPDALAARVRAVLDGDGAGFDGATTVPDGSAAFVD